MWSHIRYACGLIQGMLYGMKFGMLYCCSISLLSCLRYFFLLLSISEIFHVLLYISEIFYVLLSISELFYLLLSISEMGNTESTDLRTGFTFIFSYLSVLHYAWTVHDTSNQLFILQTLSLGLKLK